MTRSHGTAGRYQKGCRCDVCTDANTERNRLGIQSRIGREPEVHNASTYRNWGCTCDICTKANRERMNRNHAAAGRGENRGREWTSTELQVALERKDSRRYARTALEAAVMLGRSVPAVNRVRTLQSKENK